MRRVVLVCLVAACSNSSNGHHPDLSTGGGSDLTVVDLSSEGGDLAGADLSGVQSEDMATGDLGPSPSPTPPAVSFDDAVRAIVEIGDSWYFGGNFTRAQVVKAAHLLPLDGAHDLPASCVLGEGFDAAVSGILRVGAAIYVVGDFDQYNGQVAHRIAKLDAATCALDTSFSPQASTNGFDDSAYTLASDGTWLYVGGAFTSYRGVANNAHRIVRLALGDGSLDPLFGPAGASSNGFDNSVFTMVVVGTSICVGGGFTAYKGAAGSANHLARIDLNSGALVPSFGTVGANGVSDLVFSMATDAPPAPTPTPSPGPNLYIGGRFTSYNNGGVHAVGRFVKISVDGTLDASFSTTGADDDVHAVAVSADAVYLGGDFTTWGGSAATRLAKANRSTGDLDLTFNPSAASGVDDRVLALALDGSSLYAGGLFTSYLRGGATAVHHVVWLDESGNLVGAVEPTGAGVSGVNQAVYAIAAGGGSLYLGGDFIAYGGLPANYIAKVDSNGVLDGTFMGGASGGFDGEVFAFAVQGSSLYVGGGFTAYRGVADSAHRIAKLDPTSGDLDTVFSSPGPTTNGFDSTVFALAGDGSSLYAGGAFTAYRGAANSANHIAKLNPTSGDLDTVFSSPGPTTNGFDVYVSALAVEPMPSPAIFAGGAFQHAYVGGTTAVGYLAKLDPTTGARDPLFSPASSGMGDEVDALAIAGTSLYVGGYFTSTSGGASANHLAKLALSDATLDTTFSPTANNGTDGSVFTLLAMGGSLYVGGYFSQYRGGSANALAKLDLVSGLLDTTFSPPGANGVPTPYEVDGFGGSGSTLYIGGQFLRYRTSLMWNLVRVDAISGAVE
jgi:hypothetical protein